MSKLFIEVWGVVGNNMYSKELAFMSAEDGLEGAAKLIAAEDESLDESEVLEVLKDDGEFFADGRTYIVLGELSDGFEAAVRRREFGGDLDDSHVEVSHETRDGLIDSWDALGLTGAGFEQLRDYIEQLRGCPTVGKSATEDS